MTFLIQDGSTVSWPTFNKEDDQYVNFKVNMSKDSIQSNFAPQARKLWIDLVPSLYKEMNDCPKCETSSQGNYIHAYGGTMTS